MSRFLLYFYVLLLISFHTNGEIENSCPKQCECDRNEEIGSEKLLRVKCNAIKDVKEISFGNISSEIAYL